MERHHPVPFMLVPDQASVAGSVVGNWLFELIPHHQCPNNSLAKLLGGNWARGGALWDFGYGAALSSAQASA